MKNLEKYLVVSEEVKQALAEGKPVVALESTIISHGMPYPKNVETALNVEKIVREQGAVPATIAIIKGKITVGLSEEEIESLGKEGLAVTTASRRDLPILCALGTNGATTVATTMIGAALAGVKIFATGGIGGVHRGAETTMDISADLEEFAMTPVLVVCAGCKSILDIGLTLEYLETHGVTVGLIPCADGGTCLDQWRVGGLLYDHAVMQARLALRTSTIAGVLWHQGEGDCADDRYPLYEEKFTHIMNALRRDLDLYDVPFILGGLGDFLKLRSEALANYPYVNEQLKNISANNPMTGFVSAEGLGANDDNLHFSAKALRELGLRYYDEFEKYEDKNKIFEEKSDMDSAIRSEMELL